jgi:hypothetical protein
MSMRRRNMQKPAYRTLIQEYKYAGISVYRCCNCPNLLSCDRDVGCLGAVGIIEQRGIQNTAGTDISAALVIR